MSLPDPPTSAALRCDCEPTVYDDGSRGHEDTCPVRPWCPHDMGGLMAPENTAMLPLELADDFGGRAQVKAENAESR